MEDQLCALGLVLNRIPRGTPSTSAPRPRRCVPAATPSANDDIARLSLYVRGRLNVDDHSSFALPELAGARRALRDPGSPDDDA